MRSNTYEPVTGGAHRMSFVIKFDRETDITADRFEGRIEHVPSGSRIRFHSLAELLSFIDLQLKEDVALVTGV